jgi:hypothetical protein
MGVSPNSLRVTGSGARLDQVERAFRATKGVDLKVRPIYHWLETRVRAHVFMCMLAYYVEWHMRQALSPVLFEDEEHGAKPGSPVAPARRSEKAEAKARNQRLEDGAPAHSFRTLLKDLGTLARNRIEVPGAPAFDMLTRSTALQQCAFELLGVNPTGAVPSRR